MSKSTKVISTAVAGLMIAAGTSFALLFLNRSNVSAQTPPAPCACSRATSIAGTDEVSAAQGQFLARFGVVHCQCGAATCVSQIPLVAGGVHQLACVK
jgi:hypothetical protein